MKMKKVEIEIPEDMDVQMVRPCVNVSLTHVDKLVVELAPRPPRKLVFEEIIGRESILAGDYYSNEYDPSYFNMAHEDLPLEVGDIVWRLV